MTIAEQYFKDKIDWKIFNSILDACIDVEDANKYFKLQVALYNQVRLTNRKDDYSYEDFAIIYTYIDGYYPKLPGGGLSDKFSEPKTEYTELKYAGHGYSTAIDIARMKWEKFGLFYILSINDENIKLLKPMSKKIEIFKEKNGIFVYRKKEN